MKTTTGVTMKYVPYVKYLVILLLLISFTAVDAVPPPRGIDPVEAKKRERKQKIEREKARKNDMWCYIKEKKRLSNGGYNCIYKCPLEYNIWSGKREHRIENNSVGPGFGCPSQMNVLRR